MIGALTVLAVCGWLIPSVVARHWWRQAAFDQLTGLPNRGRLERLAARARRRRATVGVLLLDVDRFKQVNDTYGHRVGDELLTAFADRLAHATDRRETAIRLHGDEFAVWLGAARSDEAARRAVEVAAELSRPVVVAGHELVMTASVGHATGPARAPLAELLHAADTAMYAAKRAGRAVPNLPAAEPAPRLRDHGKDAA
ncbi:GGDEF domain-containing protein [Saccharomonospora sp. NPDC046836]|uniref:GGDEF domain-containing protein n=1 Tax=Saccharomonospora sp. NPDC046836 TaxID=3156921 RepID=UPI003410D345